MGLGAVFFRTMRTNHNPKLEYAVKIIAGYNFPDSQPLLYVVSPLPDVPSIGHESHTNGRDEHGQRICAYANWDSRNTILQAGYRIRLWLEAYEGSRKGGVSIDMLVNHD